VFENGRYRIYTEKEIKTQFPKAFAYLQSHQVTLKKRKQFQAWYGYSAPRSLELHGRAQIMVPLLANKGLFTLIPEAMRGNVFVMASAGFSVTILGACRMKPEYVLGLLNSRLLFWKLEQMSNVFRGGWITCTKQYFGELPIRVINFSNASDKSRHDHMVKLVEQMLSLHRQQSAARTPQEQIALARQIAATDTQIDRLVYDLHGLSEEEIKIVEEAAQ
jgi:hypothetical protein